MKQNRELEYKIQLTQEQYDTIKNTLFSDQTAVFQQNDYYDTPSWDISKRNWVCRIRHTNKTNEFTLKTPHKVAGLIEHSFKDTSISIQDARITTLMESLNIPLPLQFVASSKTWRYEFNDGIGIITLDYTTFHHSSDYELEYEIVDFTQDYVHSFRKLCARFNLENKPSQPKIVRTFKDFNIPF